MPWAGSSVLAYDMHSVNGPFAIDKFQADPDWISDGFARTPNSITYDSIDRCDQAAAALFEGLPCLAPNDNREGSADFRSAAPRSAHTGGVNTAFLDGHVAFTNDDIDGLVMTYQVYVRDGAVINQ